MSINKEKYKKVIPKKIRINHKNIIRFSSIKENETDFKIKKIINILYSDLFQQILIISRTNYLKNVEKKLDKIILEQYPEYITIKKEYIDSLKKEINSKYNNQYILLKKTINNFIKIPELFQFVTNFTPHCSKCDKIAYHNCINSLTYGKFIQVNSNNNDYVICTGCHLCYKSELIEMYCRNCKKNFYSELIKDNNTNTLKTNTFQKKLPFATWEKYHCGFIINEIMKCIKCKSNFYYDNINNKLICLNPACRFESNPKSIIWKCSICSSDFISSVKAFNPLEIKIYKNSISYALIVREKARPYKVNYCNFCGGDISKATFYHKKDCDGELLMSKLNNKEVVVCSRCHGMNFYSQYSWICPLCDRKLKNKNFFNLIKSNDNFLNNTTKSDNIEKNVFSYNNKDKTINNFKNIQNLKLYKKKNLFRNSITGLNSLHSIYLKKKSEKYNQNTSENNKIKINKLFHKDLNKENSASNMSKRRSYFSIKNLFMRYDSEEKFTKSTSNLNSNNKLKNSRSQNNSNSLGKTNRKKTTLFDILQKRYKEKSISNSKDKNELINNNIKKNYKNTSTNNSINHTNINNITLSKNYLNNKVIYNKYRKTVPYRFTIKEKFLRNNTENNLIIYDYNNKIKNNLNLNENESTNQKEKVKRIIYNKNSDINIKLGKGSDKENIKEDISKDSIPNKYMHNHITKFSFYNREKEKFIENKMKFQKKIKEEIRKMKNDNKIPNRNNIRYKLFENKKSNYEENKENKDFKINNNEFRISYNKLSSTNNSINSNKIYNNNDKYKIDLKRNIGNNGYIRKIINNNLSPESEKNNKITKLQYNTKPIKNKIEENKIYNLNYSNTIETTDFNKTQKESKSLFQISLKKEMYSLERKSTKPMSRRRYYQSLTKNSKEKDNKSINIENNTFHKLKTLPLLNEKKTNTNLDINNLYNSNDKLANNIKEINLISTYTNSNSNTNIIKDNNEVEVESQTNIDFADFGINDSDRNNFVSDSKINSIINNGIQYQKNIIYSSEKVEELIQSCNLPKFNDTDYIFKNSIGEGAFGTIFEVEEINAGNKYAIKKIICKDLQELINQKAQLELEYSNEHKNIIKIYKIQIKSLDITTYSISVLMELAISDWNQEILKRAKTNNYYKEKELVDITKQIINGLLFLKKKNIAHRDIKPQNILIFPNNVFKIADFGEAKNISKGTNLSTLKGCELYMSPALYWGRFHGKKNLVHNTFKSDIFSLGYCLLYAMTLNINILEKIRKLNNNSDIIDVIYNSVNHNVYSYKFLDIIYKMINLDEQQRYDFESLYNDIENYN